MKENITKETEILGKKVAYTTDKSGAVTGVANDPDLFETDLYSLKTIIDIGKEFKFNVNDEVLLMLKQVTKDLKEVELTKDKIKTKNTKIAIVVNVSYSSKKSFIKIYKVK